MSSFLAFLYIAIIHTGLAIHREHSKQSMIMHLSDSHVRGNIYFTTKEQRKKLIDAADSKERPIRKYQTHVLLKSMSKI